MAERICTVPDCQRPRKYRHYCDTHYRRIWSHGTLELTNRGKTLLQRFEQRITPAGECWEWTGQTNGKGYGRMVADGRVVFTHRWSYGYHRAEIPDGLVIDHLCRNTLCVNPWHLEPVPTEVNSARGYRATRTHCEKGHEYTAENTYYRRDRNGSRVCRACEKARSRKRAIRNRPRS